jgi:hypothetical protein
LPYIDSHGHNKNSFVNQEFPHSVLVFLSCEHIRIKSNKIKHNILNEMTVLCRCWVLLLHRDQYMPRKSGICWSEHKNDTHCFYSYSLSFEWLIKSNTPRSNNNNMKKNNRCENKTREWDEKETEMLNAKQTNIISWKKYLRRSERKV